MDLSDLSNRIAESFDGSQAELQRILDIVSVDQSVFPFNEYEHLICGLMDEGGLTYERYLVIREDYLSQNPNLWLFEISAPRGFGSFAETYVSGMSPHIVKASKKVDPSFGGEYDLWLDGIRIEVKASRGVDSDSAAPLYVKALSRGTARPFLMNYQQLKPQYCDVFVWVAVFRDEIDVWVLGSADVLSHELYSRGQHRGNSGNEGQLHVTRDNIERLAPYRFMGGDISSAISEAATRSALSSEG